MKEANIRTVRGEAVVYILSIAKPTAGSDGKITEGKIFNEDGSYQDKIKVTTTVSNTGKIGKLIFDTAEEGDVESCVKSTDDDNKGGYDVTVIIEKDALEGEEKSS